VALPLLLLLLLLLTLVVCVFRYPFSDFDSMRDRGSAVLVLTRAQRKRVLPGGKKVPVGRTRSGRTSLLGRAGILHVLMGLWSGGGGAADGGSPAPAPSDNAELQCAEPEVDAATGTVGNSQRDGRSLSTPWTAASWATPAPSRAKAAL